MSCTPDIDIASEGRAARCAASVEFEQYRGVEAMQFVRCWFPSQQDHAVTTRVRDVRVT
jgi:hypothetical protein